MHDVIERVTKWLWLKAAIYVPPSPSYPCTPFILVVRNSEYVWIWGPRMLVECGFELSEPPTDFNLTRAVDNSLVSVKKLSYSTTLN